MPIFQSMTRSFRVLLPLSAAALAGCSADVARFDFPGSAGFSGGSQTSSIPVPPANVYGSPPRAGLLGDADGASHAPPPMSETGRDGDVRVAELPPTNDAYNQPASGAYERGRDVPPAKSYDRTPNAGYDNVTAKPYDAAPRSSRQRAHFETASQVKASGDAIEVKPGDTLYGLSKQHGVPVREIMAANDLKGHSLKPGQRLTLPSGKGDAAAVSRASEAASSAPSIATTETASDVPGTYTMKPGDSLYAIARQHKVKYAELQRHNGITDADVRKIRPGTVLKIPGADEASGTTTTAAEAPAPVAPVAEGTSTAVAEAPKAETKVEAAIPSPPTGDTPKILNAAPSPSMSPAAGNTGNTQVAAIDPATTANDAATQQAAKAEDKSSGARLRWPVQGRIISPFGPRPDGTHNDGVNFSVPLGTDVHAAEGGEVIYVGDELKAYGKLVLLRHDNGWVTAYAHNEELLVTRGKKVSRGDVIAKAGKTGPVDQPQVHFELRQDSKAVDPTSFMEKL